MSGAIIAIKKKIRRACEIPLKAVSQATSVPVEWQGKPLDVTGGPPAEKFKFGMGAIVVEILEIGPNPMFNGHGRFSIVVCTKPGGGEDRNDHLAGIVAEAYPYGETLSFDGVNVFVDKIESGSYAVHGGYFFCPVTVMWNTYRRGS